jgi:hypothetical protein
MLQLVVVFLCCLGVVDVIGSCANALRGGSSFYLQPYSFLLIIMLYFPAYLLG